MIACFNPCFNGSCTSTARFEIHLKLLYQKKMLMLSFVEKFFCATISMQYLAIFIPITP